MKLQFYRVSKDYAQKQINNKRVDEYETQARTFLMETETDLETKFLFCGKHFPEDKEDRNIYLITIKNSNGEWCFNFGDSINNTTKLNGCSLSTQYKYKPNAYSVLACLNVDYSDGFADFCDNYGYDKVDYDNNDGNFINETSMRTFRAVQQETENIKRMFSEDEIEKLHEIC